MRKTSPFFLTNDWLYASIAPSMKSEYSARQGERGRLLDLGFAVIVGSESTSSVSLRALRLAGFAIDPTHAQPVATKD
jgi:hypothetical protein